MFGRWNGSRFRTFAVAVLVIMLSAFFSTVFVACGEGVSVKVVNSTDFDVDFYVDREFQGEVEARETRSFGGITEGAHLFQAKIGGEVVASDSGWVDSNNYTFSIYYQF